MLTAVMLAIASTNIQNFRWLSRPLSPSEFIVIDASGFARTLQPSLGRFLSLSLSASLLFPMTAHQETVDLCPVLHMPSDHVRKRAYIVTIVVQSGLRRVLKSRILDFEEKTMFGYGLIGTLVVIVLVVWLVRAL